jgi:hypothetical protein
MARLSAVRAPLLRTVGLAACSGGGNDLPTAPAGAQGTAFVSGYPGLELHPPRSGRDLHAGEPGRCALGRRSPSSHHPHRDRALATAIRRRDGRLPEQRLRDLHDRRRQRGPDPAAGSRSSSRCRPDGSFFDHGHRLDLAGAVVDPDLHAISIIVISTVHDLRPVVGDPRSAGRAAAGADRFPR